MLANFDLAYYMLCWKDQKSKQASLTNAIFLHFDLASPGLDYHEQNNQQWGGNLMMDRCRWYKNDINLFKLRILRGVFGILASIARTSLAWKTWSDPHQPPFSISSPIFTVHANGTDMKTHHQTQHWGIRFHSRPQDQSIIFELAVVVCHPLSPSTRVASHGEGTPLRWNSPRFVTVEGDDSWDASVLHRHPAWPLWSLKSGRWKVRREKIKLPPGEKHDEKLRHSEYQC